MGKKVKDEYQECQQQYIETCDRQLVHALAQRMCACQMLGMYAQGHNVNLKQESQAAMKKRLQAYAKEYNIPYDMVKKVYVPIIKLSKQLFNLE